MVTFNMQSLVKMEKSLFFQWHFIGIIILIVLSGTLAINEKDKVVDAPLLDTEKGTLVATIDMSSANDRIKAYISEAIEMKMSELVKMKLQEVFGALKIDQDLKLYIENVKANLTLENEIKKYVDGLKQKVPDSISEDECSDPYRRVGKGCYLIQIDKVSGDAAFAKCLQRGAYLANFETINEAMLMQSELVRMNTGVHYYIGGRNINRYKQDGDWRWITKNGEMVQMKYFAFDKGEPNGINSAPQDCMFFYASRKYKFHSVWCENGNLLGGYICQK